MQGLCYEAILEHAPRVCLLHGPLVWVCALGDPQIPPKEWQGHERTTGTLRTYAMHTVCHFGCLRGSQSQFR